LHWGGPGSKFFENAQVGWDVKFIGPLGQFVYKDSDRPSYFFATGTGVVPFIPMVEYALDSIKLSKELKVFNSFRFQEEIFGRELFERLANQYANFKYILTVTKPNESWQGKRGRITDYYQGEIPNPQIDAYICGSQGAIAGIKQDLVNLGVPDQQVCLISSTQTTADPGYFYLPSTILLGIERADCLTGPNSCRPSDFLHLRFSYFVGNSARGLPG